MSTAQSDKYIQPSHPLFLNYILVSYTVVLLIVCLICLLPLKRLVFQPMTKIMLLFFLK